MNEWWTAQEAGLIGGVGGAVIGVVFGGVGGGLGGPLAAKGMAKAFVLGMYYVGIVIGVVCLGIGVYAVSIGQPYHVWYPPLLGGLLLCAIMTPLLFVIRTKYREHDQRRLAAEELRRA